MKKKIVSIWVDSGQALFCLTQVIATKQCFHYIETTISYYDGLSAFHFAGSHIRIGNWYSSFIFDFISLSDSVTAIALHRRFEYRCLAKWSVLRLIVFSLARLDGWRISTENLCESAESTKNSFSIWHVLVDPVVLCACIASWLFPRAKWICRLDLKFNFGKRFFIIFIWCSKRSMECEFMCMCGSLPLRGQRLRLNWVRICVCVVWQKPIFVAVT